MSVRVRIAPSPTGDPHVGTAYAALFNMALARRHGGSFILRIEDTDRTRSTHESEAQIFDALHWLGLEWDEGPDVGGPHGPYRQSERQDIHTQHTWRLVEKGAAYLCFCTAERLDRVREERRARKLQPKYDGHCRNLPAGEVERLREEGAPFVIRLACPLVGSTSFTDELRGVVTTDNDQLDDQILIKSDGFPTYHLANVVDDHLMGITHVLRAEEWIPSTPKHVLLYDAFGWTPPRFVHIPLLRNPNRAKISKRKNPTSLLWYRANGFLPEALVNFLALQGTSMPDGREQFRAEEFFAAFDIGRIHTTGPVFDMEKLEWLNGVYIRDLPPEELARRLEEFGVGCPPALLPAVVPLMRERIRRLSDFTAGAEFFWTERPLEYETKLLCKKLKDPEKVLEGLLLFDQALAEGIEMSPTPLEEGISRIAEKMGISRGPLFMVLRVAMTGSTATPPLCESMVALGTETCRRRVREAVDRLRGPGQEC